MDSLEDYVSVKAAAELIGIKPMALYQRIHRGTVTHKRISGSVVVLHKEEVARLKALEETPCS